MKIDDLAPGTVLVDHVEGHRHTFVALVPSHPLYPQLRMVIWRRDNGEWYHDALSGMMDVSIVGDIESTDPDILQANLKRSLLDPSQLIDRSSSNAIRTSSPRPKRKGHW